MSLDEDIDNHKHNLMYYNQMVDRGGNKQGSKKSVSDKSKSFSSQKVDFSDYLIAPEGYESVVYPIYIVSIPYIVGVLFLFLFIAGANVSKFMLLDMKSFLIVWMIGYEIVATLLLAKIFIAFLKYDDKRNNARRY